MLKLETIMELENALETALERATDLCEQAAAIEYWGDAHRAAERIRERVKGAVSQAESERVLAEAYEARQRQDDAE